MGNSVLGFTEGARPPEVARPLRPRVPDHPEGAQPPRLAVPDVARPLQLRLPDHPARPPRGCPTTSPDNPRLPDHPDHRHEVARLLQIMLPDHPDHRPEGARPPCPTARGCQTTLPEGARPPRPRVPDHLARC